MKLSRRPFLLLSSAMLFSATTATAQDIAPFLGNWFATLNAGAVKLRLRLEIGEGPRATLFSLDQGGAPIPASSVRIEGTRLSLSWQMIKATYEGTLNGGAIIGTFNQGSALPLTFTRTLAQTAPAIVPLTQAHLAKLRQESGAAAIIAGAAKLHRPTIGFTDGVRAIGHPQLATLSDKWHIGSCTKSVTATLVARLVEAGKLSWTDTVGQILAASVPNMRAEYRDVNFLHLLSHRSGIAGNISLAELEKFPRENPDPRADRLRYANIALAAPPAGSREQHFEYANSGFVLAGAMLEQKLGKPWETIVREHVLDPLGMQGAGFGAPGAPGQWDQPVGHNLGPTGALSPFPPGAPINDNPAVMGPAGRLHATLGDMMKYLTAHATAAPFLQAQSWKTLHTPPFGGDYALGWIVKGNSIWHNGSNSLWYAEMSADRSLGVTAFAAVNDGRLGNVQPAVNNALQCAAAAMA